MIFFIRLTLFQNPMRIMLFTLEKNEFYSYFYDNKVFQ